MTRSRPVFRLLLDGIADPFMHFAVEEALLRALDDGTGSETLRLRRVVPSVWIGVYQVPEEDVDLKYCRIHDLPIVRRHNPGGAVYQDEGSFCFSLFFKHAEFFERTNVSQAAELYPMVAKAVIDTCAEYGAQAAHSPTNDVTIGGRKVYGSAQVEWGRAFVHSGTFLVSTDCEVMAKVLRPSRLKFADKGFDNVRDRVITLSEATGLTIQVDEVMWKLAGHLANHLEIELVPGSLSEDEHARADELYRSKYSRPEWTSGSRPVHNTTLSAKAPSGVITLVVDLDGLILRSVAVRGDFLLPRQADLQELTESMTGTTLEEARNLVKNSPLPGDLIETLTKLLAELEFSD